MQRQTQQSLRNKLVVRKVQEIQADNNWNDAELARAILSILLPYRPGLILAVLVSSDTQQRRFKRLMEAIGDANEIGKNALFVVRDHGK